MCGYYFLAFKSFKETSNRWIETTWNWTWVPLVLHPHHFGRRSLLQSLRWRKSWSHHRRSVCQKSPRPQKRHRRQPSSESKAPTRSSGAAKAFRSLEKVKNLLRFPNTLWLGSQSNSFCVSRGFLKSIKYSFFRTGFLVMRVSGKAKIARKKRKNRSIWSIDYTKAFFPYKCLV